MTPPIRRVETPQLVVLQKVTVPASSSPQVVPLPMSDPAAVDPEEALVAALASCHMMSFLHLASRKALDVASYVDTAEGELGRRENGRTAMLSVVLHPRIEWTGEAPDKAKLDQMHHEAHEVCFIANSVKTEVSVA